MLAASCMHASSSRSISLHRIANPDFLHGIHGSYTWHQNQLWGIVALMSAVQKGTALHEIQLTLCNTGNMCAPVALWTWADMSKHTCAYQATFAVIVMFANGFDIKNRGRRWTLRKNCTSDINHTIRQRDHRWYGDLSAKGREDPQLDCIRKFYVTKLLQVNNK